jgi:hypothetical protein
METLDSPFRDFFCPEYPPGTLVNYALGGTINLEDIPVKRRKGSMMWTGMSSPHGVSFRRIISLGIQFADNLP